MTVNNLSCTIFAHSALNASETQWTTANGERQPPKQRTKHCRRNKDGHRRDAWRELKTVFVCTKALYPSVDTMLHLLLLHNILKHEYVHRVLEVCSSAASARLFPIWHIFLHIMCGRYGEAT